MTAVDILAIGWALTVFLLVAAIADLRRARRPEQHLHCWHWMFTTDAGRIVYQHCCQCGAVSATHVVGSWGEQPWRYADHGRYIAYTGEVDYRNKTA